MRGIILIGYEKALFEDLIRDIVALAIAYKLNPEINFIANGEILISRFENLRFDHVAGRIDLPLDLRRIVSNMEPQIIVEDSTSSRRLTGRRATLKELGIPIAYLLINKSFTKDLVLSLTKAIDQDDLYIVEVGSDGLSTNYT